MAEGDIDYESDPEEAKLSLKLRRREASDEEVDEDRREKLPRRIDDSDGESEGAAEEYEDELEEEKEYDLDEEYLEEVIEEMVAVGRLDNGEGAVAVAEEDEEKKGVDNEAGEVDDENIKGAKCQHEEETKDVEPFAVPKSGMYYMHDDRFRDSGGWRHRRTLGGRKLWESKYDRKWGHDKFEELTVHKWQFEEPRKGSRGRNTGHGKNRGTERIYAQVNRTSEYSNNNTQNNNNQTNAPKSVRGRGPRRYQQSFNNSSGLPVSQNKQSRKSFEKDTYVNSERAYEPVSNRKYDATLPRKQVASSLNIASPPFYPTGSFTKDNTVTLKRDVQAGTNNGNSLQSVVDEKFHKAQSTATIRGRIIVDSISVENLYIDDSPSGKPSNSMQVPLSQLRGQGRGLTSSRKMAYQPIVSKNQFNKGLPSQMHNVRRNPGQRQVHTSVPQGAQPLPSGPQASKAAGAVNAYESGEVESASESKTSLVAAEGKESVQGSGKGPFLCGGTQIMGSGHGDQIFRTFLPVMQFGHQHPGGIGVPAVGMAFPGYVAQPQFGLGSSEMTWLPVLAGVAGTLGASYCPPHISMDGSYNARPSGLASSITAASSKENNAVKVGDDGKPAQRPDIRR